MTSFAIAFISHRSGQLSLENPERTPGRTSTPSVWKPPQRTLSATIASPYWGSSRDSNSASIPWDDALSVKFRRTTGGGGRVGWPSPLLSRGVGHTRGGGCSGRVYPGTRRGRATRRGAHGQAPAGRQRSTPRGVAVRAQHETDEPRSRGETRRRLGDPPPHAGLDRPAAAWQEGMRGAWPVDAARFRARAGAAGDQRTWSRSCSRVFQTSICATGWILHGDTRDPPSCGPVE